MATVQASFDIGVEGIKKRVVCYAIAGAIVAACVALLAWQAALIERSAAASILLAGVLISLSSIDAATQRLPDALTLPLIAAGLLLSHSDLGLHALGATAWFILLAAIAWGFEKNRGFPGLGLGDAKLMAAAAAWLGPEAAATVLLLACLLCLGLVVVQGRGGAIEWQQRIPFGPSIALGFWLVWLFGHVSMVL